jgi:hypothetical protein
MFFGIVNGYLMPVAFLPELKNNFIIVYQYVDLRNLRDYAGLKF